MSKIVILDGNTLNPGDLSWSGFEKLGELTVYDRTSPEDILPRIGDSEIVITNKTPLTAETIASCPQIKYIGVLATGYNVVDTGAAKSASIPITNIPAYGTDAVAQHTIALLLEICNRVGHHSEAVQNGKWSNSKDFCFWDYPLMELANKTMGVIGYGRIGQATGRIAQALGMKVIAFDAHHNPELECATMSYTTLDELFSKSDVISLHCPLFSETEGIVNKPNIEKMKDGVIILNTSRGPLIVEKDLAEALDSGKVFAAAVDVVSFEPIKADNPLLKAKNCVITPHIAWASRESRARLMDIAVKNLEKFLGGSPENVVNA